MPIRNSLQSSAFDPGDVERLARVFEEVCVTLASPNCEGLLREVVAREVIECAQHERDPELLYEIVLSEMQERAEIYAKLGADS
jgi:hypothetical protein